jgi:hypothetical protein
MFLGVGKGIGDDPAKGQRRPQPYVGRFVGMRCGNPLRCAVQIEPDQCKCLRERRARVDGTEEMVTGVFILPIPGLTVAINPRDNTTLRIVSGPRSDY